MKRTLIVFAFGLAIATQPITAAAFAADDPPSSARLMTAPELLNIYSGKSWAWAHGAGYMQQDQRKFLAWSGSGDAASYAEGRWLLTDLGRLCFKAEWHSQSGAYPNLTCFLHMVDGGTIYQKRLPKGEWYIFKHARSDPGDEYNKIKNADLASEQVIAAKAAIGQ